MGDVVFDIVFVLRYDFVPGVTNNRKFVGIIPFFLTDDTDDFFGRQVFSEGLADNIDDTGSRGLVDMNKYKIPIDPLVNWGVEIETNFVLIFLDDSYFHICGDTSVLEQK